MLLSQFSFEESVKIINYGFCYTAQIKCVGQNGFCVCSSDKTANTWETQLCNSSCLPFSSFHAVWELSSPLKRWMWQECVIEVGKDTGLEMVRDTKYKRRDRRLCIFDIRSPLVTGSWVPPLPAVSNTCECPPTWCGCYFPSAGKVVVCCCNENSLSSFWSLFVGVLFQGHVYGVAVSLANFNYKWENDQETHWKNLELSFTAIWLFLTSVSSCQ